MKEEHAAAAAASGRPEMAPHSFRQSGHADDKRDAVDAPGGMPADDIPQDGLLLETEGSAYAESGSKASHVLDSDDEAEKLARMSINAESSMGPLQSMEQPPMHFGTALPLSMSKPSVESVERFSSKGIEHS